MLFISYIDIFLPLSCMSMIYVHDSLYYRTQDSYPRCGPSYSGLGLPQQ